MHMYICMHVCVCLCMHTCSYIDKNNLNINKNDPKVKRGTNSMTTRWGSSIVIGVAGEERQRQSKSERESEREREWATDRKQKLERTIAPADC